MTRFERNLIDLFSSMRANAHARAAAAQSRAHCWMCRRTADETPLRRWTSDHFWGAPEFTCEDCFSTPDAVDGMGPGPGWDDLEPVEET